MFTRKKFTLLLAAAGETRLGGRELVLAVIDSIITQFQWEHGYYCTSPVLVYSPACYSFHQKCQIETVEAALYYWRLLERKIPTSREKRQKRQLEIVLLQIGS